MFRYNTLDMFLLMKLSKSYYAQLLTKDHSIPDSTYEPEVESSIKFFVF